MSSHASDTIHSFLAARRRAFVAAAALHISLVALALLALFAACLILLFFFLPLAFLPLTVAAVLFLLLAAIPSAFLFEHIRRPSLLHIARLLEGTLPGERHMLSLSLELANDTSPLALMAKEKALADLTRYAKALRRPPRAAGIAAALSFVVLAATWLTVGSALSPWLARPFAILAPVEARVLPGSCRLAAGSDTTLLLRPLHRGSPSAMLELKEKGSALRRILLRPQSDGSFSYATGALRGDLSYSFRLGGRLFGPDTIAIVLPPALSGLAIRIVPPAGLGATAFDMPPGRGDIRAPAGSTARVHIAATGMLASALLVARYGEKTDTLTMSSAACSASVTLRIARSGTYALLLQDDLGQRGSSAEFAIALSPDLAPLVNIVRPGENRAVEKSMREELLIAAADDNGVSALSLHWLSGRGRCDTAVIPLKGRERAFDVSYAWNLKPLSLYPGDTVWYWASVQDGRGQTGISDTFFFRLPSFAEIHARASASADDASGTMESVKKMQKTAAKQLKELSRAADASRKTGNPETSYEDKKIAEDLKATMNASADSLKAAVSDLQKAIEEMKGSQNTAALASKMEDLHKAVAELVKQYGDSALINKKSDPATMTAADLRQSVERLKKMLPDLAQRLEQALRAIEALKRNLALGSLVKSAETLSREQAQLAAADLSAAETSEREQSISQEAKELAAKVEEYMKKDSSLQASDLPSLADVKKQAHALSAASKGGSKPSKNDMASMSGSLSQMASELSAQMQQDMSAAAKADKARLLAAAADALLLSQWQGPTDRSWPRSEDDRADMAKTMQAGRDALRNMRSRLDSVASLSPMDLVEPMAALAKADAALADRIAQMSGMGMRPGAVGSSMNSLGQQLMAAAKKADGGQKGQGQGQGQSSGEGGEGGMEQLSGKQAAVNSLTAEMLKQMLGGREGAMPGGEGEQGGEGEGGEPGQDGKGTSASREAARQAQQGIAKKLRELADQYGRDGQGGMAKRAAALADEAERIAAQMASPTADIGSKQDQLLSRMLDASLSVNKKKDEGEERKSESALTTYGGEGPGSLVLQGGSDLYLKLREELLKGSLDPATRTMLSAYADSLGVLLLGK